MNNTSSTENNEAVRNCSDGKLSGDLSSAANPCENIPVKIKGKATQGAQISRSSNYDLLLDRWRLYNKGELFASDVISACASDDYFVYVTRQGKIRFESGPLTVNRIDIDSAAVQIAAHPADPVFWFIDTENRIFRVNVKKSDREVSIFKKENVKGSRLYRTYTKEDDIERFTTYIYWENILFDPNGSWARDCVIEHLKNTDRYSSLFSDSVSVTSENFEYITKNKIVIDSFQTNTRLEEEITSELNFETNTSGRSNCKEHIDYTLSYSLCREKNGYDLVSVEHICDGIPEGFSSFEDYIYNEYL